MDNLETVLQRLNAVKCLGSTLDFGTDKEKKIAPELDELLSHIAKTGRTEFPWHLLKPLVTCKLERERNLNNVRPREIIDRVMEEFFENNPADGTYTSGVISKSRDLYPDTQKLISNLNRFTGTPFTIQRLCELITEPKKYYNTTDKFLRGVEKSVMVVSTVQPDGSLITRSVPTPMTNGDLSLTNLDAIPSLPNLAPLDNSPLNTNTPETSANTTATPEVKTESDDKHLASTNAFDTSVNTKQDNENKQEHSELAASDSNCSENKEVVSKVDEQSTDTTVENAAENCIENDTSVKVVNAGVDTPANAETTTDEKATLEDEKMEQS